MAGVPVNAIAESPWALGSPSGCGSHDAGPLLSYWPRARLLMEGGRGRDECIGLTLDSHHMHTGVCGQGLAAASGMVQCHQSFRRRGDGGKNAGWGGMGIKGLV